MTLYGWTHEQWAQVVASYRAIEKREPTCDRHGLQKLRHWWLSHRWPEPGTAQIEGADYGADDAWAADAIANTLQSINTPPRITA